MNFSYELTLLIREAKALDRLGFAIPESALHVVLQADHLLSSQESLSAMLADYYKVRACALAQPVLQDTFMPVGVERMPYRLYVSDVGAMCRCLMNRLRLRGGC